MWCQERWQRIQLNSLVGLLKTFSNLNSFDSFEHFAQNLKALILLDISPNLKALILLNILLNLLMLLSLHRGGDREGGGD